MSVCLQALVEELLRRRKGLGIPRVSAGYGAVVGVGGQAGADGPRRGVRTAGRPVPGVMLLVTGFRVS